MDTMSDNLEVLWGQYRDEELGEKVKVAIIATGFDPQEVIKEKGDDAHRRTMWNIVDVIVAVLLVILFVRDRNNSYE